MVRRRLLYLVIALLWAIGGRGLAAPAATPVVNDFQHPQPGMLFVLNREVVVDWRQGLIEVRGLGSIPAGYAALPEAGVMARRAAIVDGYRKLAQVVPTLPVTADSTVEKYQLADNRFRMRVGAWIQGARILSEQSGPDGSHEVVLVLQLFGDNSLNKIISTSEQAPQIVPIPQAVAQVRFPAAPTGLVMDARGLNLEPALAAKIYDQSGRLIYGDSYVDPVIQAVRGIACYAFEGEERVPRGGHSRAGQTPLVIRAVGLRDHNVNLIVSNDDGEKILAANERSQILRRGAVVFER